MARRMKKLAGWRPYDFDTMMGINNEGGLTFSYDLEDTDTVEGSDVYNGQQSVFWKLIRIAFADEIRSMYQELRSEGTWSYPKFLAVFQAHHKKWPAALKNEDAWYKYLKPLLDPDAGDSPTAEYLEMCQGDKEEHMKWWLYNRFRYADSKWNAGDALTDTVVVRAYAKANITVTPYASIYPSVKYGSYLVQERGTRNQPCELVCPLDNVNDTETIIYSASQLADIGDLSGLKVGYASFVNATRINRIKLGDAAASYSNPNLKTLYLGNNELLQVMDIRNCPNLAGTIDASGCADLEEVYFDGTSITGVLLPNGGMLKKLHLPATVNNLDVRNQKKVTEFIIPSYSQIETLRLENVSSAFDADAIMAAMPANSRVRLVGFGWEFDNCAQAQTQLYDVLNQFRGLDEQGNNTPKAQVIGYIHVPSATGAEVAALKAQYPYVDVRADHLSATITYKTWDGASVIDTETVYDGADGTKVNSTARTSTAQYDYTPNGWSLTSDGTSDPDALVNVTEDRIVYASYTAAVRSYQITWVSDGTTLRTDTLEYGATPSWGQAMPKKGTQTATGWSPEAHTVTGAQTYTAVYLPIYTVRWLNDDRTTVLQTKTVEQGGSVSYTGSTPVSTVDSSKAFDKWDKSTSNVQSNLDVYATYESGAPTATTADGAYGVEWNYANSSPALARKGLAASFNAPSPATSVSGSGSSPFDTIAPWKDMEVVNVLANGTILHKGDAGFSMTDNDTMVYIPTFYYTAYKDTTNSKWLWAISPTELPGYKKHPGSGRYIGRYHTSGSSSAVASKSGASPLTKTSKTNFRTYSKNKGTGWYMLDLASWSALQMLYLVEFANFNSQDKLGKGWNTGSVGTMGGTDAAAYHTIKATGDHNMYRWVEDPFSNVYDWIEGLIANERAVYVGRNNAAMNDTIATHTATGITLPSASGYITGFGYSENAPFAFIPDAASGGAETTYACDYVYSDSGLMAASVGGIYYDSASCGFFYANVNSTASYSSYSNRGSRLLFEAA